MQISGNVRKLIPDKPADKAELQYSAGTGYYDDTETKTDGSFCFNGIEYQDRPEVYLYRPLTKKAMQGLSFFLNTDSFPIVRGLPNLQDPPECQQLRKKSLEHTWRKPM